MKAKTETPKEKISLYKSIKNWYDKKNFYLDENNNFRSAFKKPRNWLIGGLMMIGCMGGIKGCDALNNVIIEDSTYQGQVTNFGRDGLIWKTYEGDFAIGGEDRSVSRSFSLDEQARNGENIKELSEQLEDAVKTGKRVRVHGTEPLLCWPWRSFADYHIDKVEYIK